MRMLKLLPMALIAFAFSFFTPVALAVPVSLTTMFADTAQVSEIYCRADRNQPSDNIDEYRRTPNPELIMFQQNMMRRYDDDDERTVSMVLTEADDWYSKKLSSKTVRIANMNCREYGLYVFDRLISRGKF